MNYNDINNDIENSVNNYINSVMNDLVNSDLSNDMNSDIKNDIKTNLNDNINSDLYKDLYNYINIDKQNNINFVNKIEEDLVKIESGKVKLGRSINNPDKYGWDNEFGEDLFEVEEFETSKFLVSNREFLKFVEDNGYLQTKYWTEDGQAYLKSFENLSYPRFWRRDKDTNKWYLRTLLKEIEMPWDWPVEVNYLEAKAFCNWKQFRLLTESEHRLLRDRYVTDTTEANHGLTHQSPCSIYKYIHGILNDIVGNVWQWTESYMYPFQ